MTGWLEKGEYAFKSNQWLSPKEVNCGVIFCCDLLLCYAKTVSPLTIMVYIILYHHMMIDCHDDLASYIDISTSSNVAISTYVAISSYVAVSSNVV